MLLTAGLLGARTYYVGTAGDDNHSGDEGQPLRTIQKAVDLARAGDIVLVGPGVYKGRVVLRFSGEPGKPIIVKNVPGATPVVDGEGRGRIELQSEQGWRNPIGWITIEGFEVRAGWDGIKFYNAYQIALRRNYIHDNANQGILGNGHHVRIEGNVIARNGFKPDNERSNKEHGIYCTGTDFTIINNVIRSNKAYGIQVAGYPYKPEDHSGPEFAGARRWLISQNTIAHNQNRGGIVVWQAGAADCVIQNNVFYQNAVTQRRGACQGIDFADPGSGQVVRNNLFFASDRISVDRPPPDSLLLDNLEKDPLFVAAESFDFRLKKGSPAIDAGTAENPIRADIEGTRRPQGSANDVGAYEATDLRKNQGSSASVEKEGSLGKTRFSVQQDDGESWLVKPNGERFFSFGVCNVNLGAARSAFKPANPAYAAWQYYPDPGQWAEATLSRVKSWGFTTIGAWSDFETLKRAANKQDFAFAPVLHVGSTAGAPWWDMWNPETITRMENVATEAISKLRDEPRVIGYYTDNEMGWWNATLFRMTLEQSATSGQRRRLLQLLRERYHHAWSELLKDFHSQTAESWQDLEEKGVLYLRAEGDGIRTMRQFLTLIAERYYSLVQEIIRKQDPKALILGDRYQSFYYPEVARACARCIDCVSTNLNASWNDGTFPRFYLESLHGLAAQPVLVSEFYMAARENRSGDKNDHGIFPVVDTQIERAAGLERTLQALLRFPYVIGADWFQYYDEPGEGRFDGENFNFGLVDIKDRPYEALVSKTASLHLEALKRQTRPQRTDASQGIPRSPRNPLEHFSSMLALRDWDRERGFVKPASPFPLADLYLCWSESAVYLGLYSQDIVEDAAYIDKTVPENDRAEWTVSVGTSKPLIRARIGSGAEPVINDPAIQIANLSGLNHNVRNIAAMKVPAKLFGKESFRPGDTIDLESTLLTHCRAYRVDWNGSFKLRD